MRGQISIEYILLVGVILVVVIPLLYYSFSKTNTDIRYQQASDAVNALAKAADEVYSLGLGSRNYVWINPPEGVTNVIIKDKIINLEVAIYGDRSDFVAKTNANLTATQDLLNKLLYGGSYKVSVEVFKNITTGDISVLLGGFCGDNFCSSAENSKTCPIDCVDKCGDGVCTYPAVGGYVENCLTNFCADCIGSQVDCDLGKICKENTVNPGTGICVASASCGDDICNGEPYVENCNNCPSDCKLAAGELCCFDPVTDSYYRAFACGIPPTVTSCPDWCVWIGDKNLKDYDTGVCAQNPTKCINDFGIGGEYVEIDEFNIDGDGGVTATCGTQPKPPGDGECDGDEYCFAGPQANTCCCVWI